MTSRISKQQIILPEFGKRQINLRKFSWKISSSKLFIIYLPCAKQKPFYLSSTHSYFKLKVKEILPRSWDKFIQICTISEVIGIIPEDLEDEIFNEKNGNKEKYNYEHYPTHKENDIKNTKNWLIQFIQQHKKQHHIAYLTSRIFREICDDISSLETYPTEFNPSSALFEFRKSINVLEICIKIKEKYLDILEKRFTRWKERNNQPYLLLKEFYNRDSFTISDMKKNLPQIKNPYSLLYRLCQEGKNRHGFFIKRLKRGTYRLLPYIEIIFRKFT